MEERYKELTREEIERIAAHVYQLTNEPVYSIRQQEYIGGDPIFVSNFTAAMKQVLEEKFDGDSIDTSGTDLYYIPILAVEPLCRSIEMIITSVSTLDMVSANVAEETEFWDEASRIADVLEERLKETIDNAKGADLERQYDLEGLDDHALIEATEREEEKYRKEEEMFNNALYNFAEQIETNAQKGSTSASIKELSF